MRNRATRGGFGRPYLLAAALVTAVAVALAGGVARDGSGTAAAARPDLSRLVELVSSGRTTEAIAQLERSSDPDARTLLGLAYLQRFRETSEPGLMSRAERTLATAPTSAARSTGLASLAATRHRFRDALRLGRAALRVEPDNSIALGVVGEALIELGRYGQAFAAYDRMAELSPSVGAYARVAQGRELLGKRAGALEALTLALELDELGAEDRAYAQVRIGKLHQDAGRLAQARRAYLSALRARPNYPHARSGLATLELDRGRPRAAIPVLAPLLAELPSTETAIELGDALLAVGRKQDAERAFATARRIEQALAANGVRTELQSALFDLDHDRNLRAALARARAAMHLRPGIEGRHVLAWALYKNGRCGEAQRQSALALRLGTPDLDALYHRSLIEACLGNGRAAAGFRMRVRELNPLYLRMPPSPFRTTGRGH